MNIGLVLLLSKGKDNFGRVRKTCSTI